MSVRYQMNCQWSFLLISLIQIIERFSVKFSKIFIIYHFALSCIEVCNTLVMIQSSLVFVNGCTFCWGKLIECYLLWLLFLSWLRFILSKGCNKRCDFWFLVFSHGFTMIIVLLWIWILNIFTIIVIHLMFFFCFTCLIILLYKASSSWFLFINWFDHFKMNLELITIFLHGWFTNMSEWIQSINRLLVNFTMLLFWLRQFLITWCAILLIFLILRFLLSSLITLLLAFAKILLTLCRIWWFSIWSYLRIWGGIGILFRFSIWCCFCTLNRLFLLDCLGLVNCCLLLILSFSHIRCWLVNIRGVLRLTWRKVAKNVK